MTDEKLVTKLDQFILGDMKKAADEIERLKAIASKAIREQIPMREEIDSLKAQLEPFRTFASAEVIHALRAENARLRDALKPFACKFDEEGWQAIQTAKDSDWFRWVCTAGEIRAARAAMGDSDE